MLCPIDTETSRGDDVPRAVILLSAGLDSVVSFKLAYDDYDEIMCLTFDYGQRAQSKEISYASKICSIYHIAHHIVDLKWYDSFVGALTDKSALPQLNSSVLERFEIVQETAKAVWVPARNAVFLSIGAAFCENYNFDALIVGFNKEEALTFPDNSAHFVACFNKVLEYAVLGQIQVIAPLMRYEKREIVRLGLQVGAPLEWSWSCYSAGVAPCHVCESCVRRSRAFEAVKKQDPLLKRLGDEVRS